MEDTVNDDLAEVLAGCLADENPLDCFNEVVLNRVDRSRTLHDGTHPGEHWWAQKDILKALWEPEIDTIAVPSGHSVGKSFVGADAVLGWPTLHRESLVVSTSPSNTQLSGVLWKEIKKARANSPILSRIGRVTQLPNRFKLGEGWEAIGYSTNKAERIQGWHSAGPLLLLVDEASGILDPDIWATLESLKPWKKLLLGNTLHAHGYFYDACRRADDGDRTVKKIHIPSTFSPDIHRERSERGLADAMFLRNMANQYGIGSQTWNIRVLAEFPDGANDALVPQAWLDRSARAVHVPGGHRRISIDLGLGNGGDPTVIVVRDDNGILHFESNERLNMEAAASRAAQLAQRFGVLPSRITWDFEGIGVDFGNRLKQFGLVGCTPYRGQTPSKKEQFTNLRTASHWAMRRRLDPEWRIANGTVPPPFAIPSEYLGRLRRELKEITHSPGARDRIVLRDSMEVRAALRHSPDYTDALAQSFAYTNT